MEPGQAVTANIKLVRLLDEGSMGSVWVANHAGLGTQVAVKFMSPEVAQHPHLVTRFSREAHAAAQLKSPHVVQIHDHGVTPEGVPYIAMELFSRASRCRSASGATSTSTLVASSSPSWSRPARR